MITSVIIIGNCEVAIYVYDD